MQLNFERFNVVECAATLNDLKVYHSPTLLSKGAILENVSQSFFQTRNATVEEGRAICFILKIFLVLSLSFNNNQKKTLCFGWQGDFQRYLNDGSMAWWPINLLYAAAGLKPLAAKHLWRCLPGWDKLSILHGRHYYFVLDSLIGQKQSYIFKGIHLNLQNSHSFLLKELMLLQDGVKPSLLNQFTSWIQNLG